MPLVSRWALRLAPVWGLVLLLLAWESAVAVAQIPRFLLPAPSRVVAKLAANPGYLAAQVGQTAIEAVVGLAIAIVVASILAVIITRSALLERVVYPYLVLIQVTPIVAVAPLLIIWLGSGTEPKIAIAALIAFFPIVVNVTAGLKSADGAALELMRSLAASERHTFGLVRIPYAMPFAFASLRIAAPVAVVGAIVGEMVGSDKGLGFVIIRAKGILDTELLFLGIFGSAVLGIGLFLAFVLLERYAMRSRRPTGTRPA